jgi:hypothetical protein
MTKYTFTFEREDERKFREVMGRLDPQEYAIYQDVTLVEPDNPRYSKREAVLEMEPDACLTFRMAMGNAIKIRRERTEEELAEEKALEEKNTIKVTVIVPPSNGTNP